VIQIHAISSFSYLTNFRSKYEREVFHNSTWKAYTEHHLMDNSEPRNNETFIFYILGLFNVKSFVVPSIILREKKE